VAADAATGGVVRAARPGTGGVRIRPAGADDCRQFWEWRNHPSTRLVAFDQTPIPYDTHVPWFGRKLLDPATRMLVVVDADGQDIGYVRCDIADGAGEISVGLAATEQGKGYGPVALRAAAHWLLQDRGVQRLRAYVRSANERSLRAFERAGFVASAARVPMHGEDVYELTLERSS
jgi:RimJ/RimL family protein N-acetyltransferase